MKFPLTPLQQKLIQGLINFDNDKSSLSEKNLKNAIWSIMLEKYPFIANKRNKGLESQIRKKSSVLCSKVGKSAYKDFVIQARAYLDNNRFEYAIQYIIKAEIQDYRLKKMGYQSTPSLNVAEGINFGKDNDAIRNLENKTVIQPLLEQLAREVELEKSMHNNSFNLFFTPTPKPVLQQKSNYTPSDLQGSIINGMVGFN